MPAVPLGPIRSDPPEGVVPTPVIVTGESPEECRRWQVLLASKGLTVLRDDEPAPAFGAPLINAHIESHDVWLSWVQPAGDLDALRAALEKRWANNELWLDQHGRMEHLVERHHAWGRMLHSLADRGYSMVARPGNIRWLDFTKRDQHIDWRLKADVIAEMVWRVSAGEEN